jgi:hypothetical protein
LYQYGSIAMTSAFASAMDVRWADSNIDRDAVCIANGCATRKTLGKGMRAQSRLAHCRAHGRRKLREVWRGDASLIAEEGPRTRGDIPWRSVRSDADASSCRLGHMPDQMVHRARKPPRCFGVEIALGCREGWKIPGCMLR